MPKIVYFTVMIIIVYFVIFLLLPLKGALKTRGEINLSIARGHTVVIIRVIRY